MDKFICDREKYTLSGQTGDSVCLPVLLSDSSLPKELEIEGNVLSLKTEFHVTLVAMGKIIKKYEVTDPNFIEKVIADFCQFVQENPVELIRYRDEYRFMAENERRTVVVMCDVSNLDKFFEQLNKKYSLGVECPPTHVTLYTLQPNVGIFMVDSGDMQKLTKVITAPVKL